MLNEASIRAYAMSDPAEPSAHKAKIAAATKVRIPKEFKTFVQPMSDQIRTQMILSKSSEKSRMNRLM